MSVDFVSIAVELAARAHKGQLDKAGEPYILHPLRVMLTVGNFPPEIIPAEHPLLVDFVHSKRDILRAGLVLHDVFEDTKMTRDEVAAAGVPDAAIRLAEAMTRDRMGETYREFIQRLSERDLTAYGKLLDIEDNIRRPMPEIADMIRTRYRPARAELIASLMAEKSQQT